MKRWSAIGIGVLIIGILIIGASDTWAERLTVAVPNANIRSGPGTGHEILWRVEQYHPLAVIKKTGSWYLFRDFEGDTGWIHESLVANTPSVITAKNMVNVRSGPAMTHKILFTTGKGIPFKVLDKKGNWLHVQHGDGDQGWIHKSLLW